MTVLVCTLPLPADFRPADILKFHRRDALAVAEQVDADTLNKGMLWHGRPARLTIRFGTFGAQVALALDGVAAIDDTGPLCGMAQRMLGLDQPIAEFERRYRDHPQLGLLIAGQPGLRVPVAASVFEALSWAIICQQISVGAAVAIRRKLIRLTALRHSGGLYCHPDAMQVADLSESDLREAGFSQSKARCLSTVSRMVVAGDLELEYSTEELPVDRVSEQLLRIRGIGPWTVNYTLLRGFGWLDGSLHGDIAVRRGLQKLLVSAKPVGEQQARLWLEPFSPWRALVAAHLWAFLAIAA